MGIRNCSLAQRGRGTRVWTRAGTQGPAPGALTCDVDEALDLGLHAPVAELHLAQLVGAHDGEHLLLVLLDPVVRQGPPLRLGRVEQLGVLLCPVLIGGHGVLDDVDEVCGETLRVVTPALTSTTSLSLPPPILVGLWASLCLGRVLGSRGVE